MNYNNIIDHLRSNSFTTENYKDLYQDALDLDRLRKYPEWEAYERRLEMETALTIRKMYNASGNDDRCILQGAMLQNEKIAKLIDSVIDRASKKIDHQAEDEKERGEVDAETVQSR